MVGRKFTVEFPMSCDRCGRTLRIGETAVQRTYPHKTYVTHIVCPGRGRWHGGKFNNSHDNKQTQE